jgi:hypothetical protein
MLVKPTTPSVNVELGINAFNKNLANQPTSIQLALPILEINASTVAVPII